MWNWLKLRWLLLGDSAGVLLAIPPAILFGLLLTWFLPHMKQVGWSHYRLTTTIEADGHTFTASQVYAYKCNNESSRFPQTNCQIRGEAMTVDLGKRGKMFFIMNQWNADHTRLAGKDYMIARLNLAAKGEGRPTWNNLPAIVRFGDLENPETAEFIDPQNLEADYGDGVTLTQFDITEIGDAETTGLVKTLLPWLSSGHTDALGKQGAAAQLHAFDFKWPPN